MFAGRCKDWRTGGVGVRYAWDSRVKNEGRIMRVLVWGFLHGLETKLRGKESLG